MIFKRIFGKTLDAALKSAHQMYGDNFAVFNSTDGSDNRPAGISVVTDQKKQPKSHMKPKTADPKKSVRFERSEPNHGFQQNKIDSELDALRKFAKSQQNGSSFEYTGEETRREQKAPSKTEFTPDHHQQDRKTGMYGRHSIRRSAPKTEESATPPDFSGSERAPGDSLLSRFDQSGPEINLTETDQAKPFPKDSASGSEIAELHQRLDKIESLLGTGLIYANLKYVSHPAFQQLIHAGVHPGVISGWFKKIMKDGIDPYIHTEAFMSKLSDILKSIFLEGEPVEPQKYQVFLGPTGSGKTTLIMKLVMNAGFLEDKKVAVASIMPIGDRQSPYYTTLEPFCRDHNIPYFKITRGLDATRYIQEWNECDYVLIDTPSVSNADDSSHAEYLKMRQVLAPLTPLEVHYVVNASVNFSFLNQDRFTNHPVQPDYLALTHVDQISKWGSLIPLFEELRCSAKYISNGNNITENLDRFDPAWFVKKVFE